MIFPDKFSLARQNDIPAFCSMLYTILMCLNALLFKFFMFCNEFKFFIDRTRKAILFIMNFWLFPGLFNLILNNNVNRVL